jgi:hypothetical protein
MTFEDDVKYFNDVLNNQLKSEHSGKYVLVKDRQNHGIFSNIEDAHRAALEKFGVSEVVIAQIGVVAPLNYLASAIV